MKHDILEIGVVEQTAEEAIKSQVSELNELQLALVGGGMGDTVGY